MQKTLPLSQNKTSLMPPLFMEMCVSGHVCVSGLSILPLFLRFVPYYILELCLLRFSFSFHLIKRI
jgi:hypothetical protein